MRHPTDGVLRRLIDEPAGVSEPDRQHVAQCPQCLDGLTTARADASLVGAALATEDAGSVDVDAAWARLSSTTVTASRSPRVVRGRRARDLVQRPAAAALAVAVVLTGASAAAANDWLQIFRTEKITPVNITTSDLVALPDLSAYGDLKVTGTPDVREVPDRAAAASASGLDVPTVTDLPRGIGGEPVFQVGNKVVATFTFSADRAARAAADAGQPLPPVPAGVDGSQIRMMAGPGVAELWRSDAGAPGLVVGRALAPTAFSSGVPFQTVRDYLLSLPGLSPALAEQLRAFDADGSTLPLPVPADRITTRPTQVNDAPATLLRSRDRSLTAVVWVEDGVVTVVAGSLDPDEVLSVARALR